MFTLFWLIVCIIFLWSTTSSAISYYCSPNVKVAIVKAMCMHWRHSLFKTLLLWIVTPFWNINDNIKFNCCWTFRISVYLWDICSMKDFDTGFFVLIQINCSQKYYVVHSLSTSWCSSGSFRSIGRRWRWG